MVESRATTLRLTEEDARELRAVGRRLVSDKTYWRDALGEPLDEFSDEDDRPQRTLIECSHLRADEYRVKVNQAVGVVALPTTTLFVTPKIPISHFTYLMRRSNVFPRLDDAPTSLATSHTLWDLIAEWYVIALERLMRLGLLMDYRERTEIVSAARGTIRVAETANLYLQGNLALDCEFDDLSMDSSLNRVLRAAALAVAATPFLDPSLRRRARRALARFDQIGPLEPHDLQVSTDRRTASYRPAIELARHVLAATGRTIEAGRERATAFLIPTPDMIEEGVRNVLIEGLPDAGIHKKGRQIKDSKMTLNPDLVFGSQAIGDVKYKLTGATWKRPDLYQLISFATGYEVDQAAMFGFATQNDAALPDAQVGPVVLHSIVWPAAEEIEPADAAAQVVLAARIWLGTRDADAAPEVDDQYLILRGSGVEARGRLLTNGFLVASGSAATLDSVRSISPGNAALRASLVKDGSLVIEGATMRFTADVIFATPSNAASVILGSSINGRDAWRNIHGRSLNDLDLW